MELPEDQEIECCAEEQSDITPGLIKKTIRYRNGLTAVLFQDFTDSIFSIQLISNQAPFWLRRNQVFKKDHKN
jgi:hypothetical protein